MSDNPYYHQDDPTEPIRHSTPPAHDQQGKMIIGRFQDNQPQPGRRPYQNPQQQPYPSPQARQQVPPAQQQYYPQQNQQRYPGNNEPPMIERQPPQYPLSPATPHRKNRPPRKRRGCLVGCLVVLLLVCIIGGFTIFTGQRVLAFGSAISTQSPLSSQTGYMGTSDRVNLLVLGYGGSGHDGAYLTDSIVVMSLLPQSHHTTLISVPRDLWVQNPANSGSYTKINAVYPVAAGNTNTDPVAGGNAAAQKVSLITGLQVNYWMTINFTGFKEFINSIGGIDVNVPDSFNACYPKNDDASVDPSWIKIQFNKGLQHMDGATAIMYARAREPLEVCGKGTSENQAELTDFARSARQQIIIKAALSKVKSISTWPSMFNALTALEHTIYTNMSLADLAQFALKMDLTNAHHVGLSNQNVLVDSTASDGEYILAPANNNWQAIIDYVKQQLYN
jgi:polyisoprenyl-teichoic acid--peptidoglycan teichoic acid transferase